MRKIIFAFLACVFLRPGFVSAAEEVDILHYDLNCGIRVEKKLVSCRTKIKLKNKDESLSRLLFYFESPAAVSGVKIGNANISYKQNEQKTDLDVSLKAPLKPSEQKEIFVSYDIPSPHIEDGKGFSLYNPMPQSVLSGGGKESFTASLKFTVDKKYTAVAIGNFAGEKVEGASRISEWNAIKPYQMILVFVDEFKQKALDAGGVPVTVYFTGHFDKADMALQEAKEAIMFFSKVFSPYPYEKLSVIETGDKDISRRAMAMPSFTLMSPRALEKLDKDPSLIPHEVSHQWWGCLVPLGFFSETWLTEGFATYSECLFMEKQKNAPCYEGERKSYIKIAGTKEDKSVLYGYLADGGANSYRKGAWVLRMLQSVLGDDKFFQMLHEYIEKFTGVIAKNRDLRKESEKFYGEKLDWFFKEWLEGTDAMDVDFSDVKVTFTEGNYVTEGDLVQKVPFTMPVKIKCVTPVYDVTATVWMKGGKQHFSFATPVPPVKLQIDPGQELLLKERREHLFVDTEK